MLPRFSGRPPIDELLSLWESLIVKEGVTTAAGDPAGNSIKDASLIGSGVGSFSNMPVVLYPGDPKRVDSMFVTAGGFDNATGELTLDKAYKSIAAPIPAGVPYTMLTTAASSVAGLAAILALVTAINTNVGDMSADTLKSIKAKLGDNAQTFLAMIGYEATSLANKLTAARSALLDRLALLAAGGAGELTAVRAVRLDNLDALVSSRALPGDQMDLLAATLTAIQNLLLLDATPFAGANIGLIKTQTDKLGDATIGLAALKALLDAIIGYIDTEIGDIKTQTDKLAGTAPVTGSTTHDWQTAEADVVSIGANDTKNKVHSLVLSIHNLVGTVITVRLYMQVNGTERKVYQQAFDATTDPPGLWIVNGTVGIHEVLRCSLQSNNAADNGKAVDYDYMLEAM